MNINKQYSPKDIEEKWYNYWIENKLFNSIPDEREPFTIVIPPPNVTGVLHMGHMLNNTIQDILIRKARMQGFNACWVPGTDHASIATEAKVSQKLKEDGINKNSLSRKEFLNHAWDWKNKHGGIILEQLKKLGASCDWDRTKFTMDDDLSESVIDTFINLYNKGYIYRGVRMINWDTKAKTALSDEEVIYKEVSSKLYYIKYAIQNSDEFITIATTRPETILGDTAICVNPNDDRYKHLKDKTIIIPLIEREVPLIFDEYVDVEFGTGALKVTPAHDINDYNLGIKYNLKTIDTINDNGKMSDDAGLYIGLDRFDVRNKIIEDLKKINRVEKTEDIINKVGFSERTNVVIEPKLSMQWFCKMDKLAKPALENVLNDNIKFYPENIKNTYKHWMENIKDWCVSRQLWWGQQIPAYFYDENKHVVAKNKKEALLIAKKDNAALTIEDLKQDEDVLDTWFSSWLWPLSVFDGIKNPNNKEINYYYPTNDLVTAPEILFFWVARMIMSGYYFKNKLPFKNVYFTGIVRDKKRRKMSKSLGNSPDPIKLMDKYGADGVRVGMLLCSPAGNDLLFDEGLCEQGRNFSNKIWNSFRLIKSWKIDANLKQEQDSSVAINWFESKLNKSLKEINANYKEYKISEVLMTLYKLYWDDYCSWFLEAIKPGFNQPIDPITYHKSIYFLEFLLKLLHPFMPFITEEIWHLINKKDKCLTISLWPKENVFNPEIINEFAIATEIITSIRNFRKEKKIPNKNHIELEIIKRAIPEGYDSLISKMSKLSKISESSEKPKNSYSFRVGIGEYHIPIDESYINKKEEIKKLEEELEYTKGFLQSVNKKLSNPNFVNNAPQNVVNIEKKKQSDSNEKIKIIEKQLSSLKS